MKRIKGKIVIATSTFLLPATAFAAITAPITSVQGIINLMCKVFDYMFYGLIALSIIIVVIAGFNYVTAGGDSEKVSKANKMILYAAIGIAIALVARGIPLIVANFLGASASGVSSC
jgi:hypothetical protein